jgi:Fe-S-cluster containining protein
MAETSHNFERTVCACHECKACCKRQPGPLAAGDFERIVAWRKEQGFDHDVAVQWVKDHLWASPGCLVQDGLGITKRIGTITPRYRKGRCVFLDHNERCRIHPVAPFGCSHFDTHMSYETAQERSCWLAWNQQDPDYQKLRDELPYATHHKPVKYTLGRSNK